MWTSVTDCCIKIVHQITRRKSVLYVCERVNSNLGGSMATPRDTTSRRDGMMPDHQHQQQQLRPPQHDPALSYPYQVALPDGEVQHHEYEPCLRISGTHKQEEITRGYIKPPENRCLCELEPMKSPISCSMGLLPSREACNIIRSYAPSSSYFPHQQPQHHHHHHHHRQHQHRSYSTSSALHPVQRHSSPLENTHHHCQKTTTSISSLSSSSSSSLYSWSVSGAADGVDDTMPAAAAAAFPARKHTSQKHFLNISHNRQKNMAERLKRLPRGGVPLSPEQTSFASGSSSISPSLSSSSSSSSSSSCYSMHSHSPLLACPSESTALSDIAILPCGSAHSNLHFASSHPEDQVALIPGEQRQQQQSSFRSQRHLSSEYCISPSEEDPHLPSDILDAPFKDTSSLMEHRTETERMSP